MLGGRRSGQLLWASFGLLAVVGVATAAVDMVVASRVIQAAPKSGRAPVQQPARVDGAQAPVPAPTTPALVRIHVDAAARYAGSPADACSACGVTALSGGLAPWDWWCSFAGTRVSADSTSDEVPAYGARVAGGVAVVIVNHTQRAADYHLAARLPRGVFTVERLTQPLGDDATPKLERQDSAVLDRVTEVTRTGQAEAGSAVVYRYINRSGETQKNFDAVLHAVRQIREGHGGEFRRLMTPLRECGDNVAVLSQGIDPDDRYDRLRYVHRALVTLAHAQALADNFRQEGRLPSDSGNVLSGALAHVEGSLTELSAACLGLVPELRVTPLTADPAKREVLLTLRNGGTQTLAFVKIGAAAGAGCSVQPAEQALFLDLRPGETARAGFTVHVNDDADTGTICADYAWLAARVPAHLRLHNIPAVRKAAPSTSQ